MSRVAKGAAIAAGALLLLGVLVLRKPPRDRDAPRSATPPPADAPPPGLPAHVQERLASRNRKEIRAAAAELRGRARADADVLRRLGAIVLDDGASGELREQAAFVLGSLPGADAEAFLSAALAKAATPGWTRTLILALCSAKDWDDDAAFDLSGSPWVVETPSGLAVVIETVIRTPAVREQILTFLRNPSELGVREAAAKGLYHSLEFADVRKEFSLALAGERDPELKGEIGRGLSSWAAQAPADSAERLGIVSAILDQGSKPEAAALRFGTEPALRGMKLGEPEVRSLAALLEGSGFDERRWALAVLGAGAVEAGLPHREELFAAFGRLAAGDLDAKIREHAAAALGSFPDRPAAAALLIRVLADPAWHVRARAAEALGKMRGTEEVRQELRRAAAQDVHDGVRRSAEAALKRLSGG